MNDFLLEHIGLLAIIIGAIILLISYFRDYLKNKWILFFKNKKSIIIFTIIGIILFVGGFVCAIIKYSDESKLSFVNVFGFVSVLLALLSLLFAYIFKKRNDEQIEKLKSISEEIADTTRKPLLSIIDILNQLFYLAKKAKVGGEMYYIGFTFGLGVPHFNEENCIKWKKQFKGSPEFKDEIYEFNAQMRANIASAPHKKSVFVILNHNKSNTYCEYKSMLNEKFLSPLFKKPEYKKIENNIDDAISLIDIIRNDIKKNNHVSEDLETKVEDNTNSIDKYLLKFEIIKQVIRFASDDFDEFKGHINEMIKGINYKKDINEPKIDAEKYVANITSNEKYVNRLLTYFSSPNSQVRKNILLEITKLLNSMVIDKINEHHTLHETSHLPLQLFITEIIKDNKTQYAGVIFNVGTQNIEDKPRGFYTELHDICELFINYARTMNEYTQIENNI